MAAEASRESTIQTLKALNLHLGDAFVEGVSIIKPTIHFFLGAQGKH
jgi:hypothetical protein